MKIERRLTIQAIGLPSHIAIYAIAIYQKYLSPYKGYHCAYAHLYNEISCSTFGKKVIQEQGLLKGLKLLQERFHQCNQAMLILYGNNQNYDFEVRGCKLTGIKGCRIPDLSNCRVRSYCHSNSYNRCSGCKSSNEQTSDNCTSEKDNPDCVSEEYNIDYYLPEGCDMTLFDSCWWF